VFSAGIERRPNCEGAHTKKARPAEEPRARSLSREGEEQARTNHRTQAVLQPLDATIARVARAVILDS
jgi:hypothetical protein